MHILKVHIVSISWKPMGSTRWLRHSASTAESQSGWSNSLPHTQWITPCANLGKASMLTAGKNEVMFLVVCVYHGDVPVQSLGFLPLSFVAPAPVPDVRVPAPALWTCAFFTARIQCEVLTTLPILSSWIKKFLDNNQKSGMTAWSKNLRKKLNKLHGSQYPVAQCSLFKFFLKLLDQRCWRFSKGYLSNFSTELSSQIFDYCPRNFLIQEKQNCNVVSTSHWIRHVFLFK